MPAGTEALFIRSDPLDNFNYLTDIVASNTSSELSTNSQAKGASLTYTDDLQAGTEKAVINARASYLLFGINNCTLLAPTYPISDVKTGQVVGFEPNPNSFYIEDIGIAPFVSSNGTWNNPFTTTTTVTSIPTAKTTTGTTTTVTSDGITTKTAVTNKNGTITTTTKKTSTSDLRFGMDFQTGLHSPAVTTQNVFYLSPFYQTDYVNRAQIAGLDARYEPVFHVSGAPVLGLNEGYIDNNIS